MLFKKIWNNFLKFNVHVEVKIIKKISFIRFFWTIRIIDKSKFININIKFILILLKI